LITRISEEIVKQLPTPVQGNKLHYFSGAKLQGKAAPSGFAVRVTASGTKAFVRFYRVNGKGHLETIGSWRGNPKGGELSVLSAIEMAGDRAEAVTRGIDKDGNKVDPRPERTRRDEDGDPTEPLRIGGAYDEGDKKSRKGLLDLYIEECLNEASDMRSADMIKYQFKRLVAPRIGHFAIHELKRPHIKTMQKEIAKENGKRSADLCLAYCRRAFNWFAANGDDEDFVSPIVRGMSLQKPSEYAKTRTLDHDEIRDLWTALDRMPVCDATFTRFLLLTATRRSEAAEMHVRELSGDEWTIPGSRYKNKLDHLIQMSAMAREQIGKSNGFVFSTTGGRLPINGFSKMKLLLDEKLAIVRKEAGREPMKPWTYHDLRRTARTLMSEAKVLTDYAERALGHVKGGIRGNYDKHEYEDEKRDAFEKLAARVAMILNPPKDNVVPMRA
jgi:integrase